MWALNIGRGLNVWLYAHSYGDAEITLLFQPFLLHKRTPCQLLKQFIANIQKVGNKRSDSTRASNMSSSFPPVVTQILWCPKKWCQLEQSWSGLVLLDQFRLNTGAFFALHQRLDFPKELQNFEIQQSTKICFPELILGKNNHLWKNNSSFVWTLKYYLLLQNSKGT